MIPVLVLSHSILGEGAGRTLGQMTDWPVQSASPQDPAAVAELARLFRPEVTILDDTSGEVLPLFEQLGKERVGHLGMTVVVTADFQSEETLFHLALWGVAAYLSAAISLEDFITAIQRVSFGEWLLSSEELRKAPPRGRPRPAQREDAAREDAAAEQGACASPLTLREIQVLTLVAQGQATKEIARTLAVNQQTIKNHLSASFRKLGVSGRTAAVVTALSRGWIQLPACPVSPEIPLASVA